MILTIKSHPILNNYMILCLIDASACSFADPAVREKTNTLMHMIYNLLYFDKIYLYSKNLEQSKYQNLMDKFKPISDEAGVGCLV